MQAARRRGDVLEIGEHAAGLEQVEDLGVQRALAVVLEVVDRHRGDHRVEASHCRHRRGHVVLDQLDPLIAGEAVACGVEHDVGEVEPDPAKVRPITHEQGQEATIARPEVEDAAHFARHVVEQDALALSSAREFVGSAEVSIDVLSGGPFLGVHGSIIGRGGVLQRTRPRRAASSGGMSWTLSLAMSFRPTATSISRSSSSSSRSGMSYEPTSGRVLPAGATCRGRPRAAGAS